MGRWPYSSRSTVEECKSITTKCLNEHHYFDGGVRRGGISWSRGIEPSDSIGFVVSTVEAEKYIRFQYTLTERDTGEKSNLDYKVKLTWTPCYFGGRRWWFICPIVINGKKCHRRVGVLYLGNGKYFGCRHCYDLTYTSCQESHKYDRMFALLAAQVSGTTAESVKRILKENIVK